MRPKSNGSSTMGMKKSVVAITACSSLRRYTAASSDVSVPTSNWLYAAADGDRARRFARTPGAILQPHPPPWESDVSRGVGAGVGEAVIRSTSNDLAEGSRSRTYQEAADAP